jgi:hypothetical protein
MRGRMFKHKFCRSELAREESENAAGSQAASVTVNDHREQARSCNSDQTKTISSFSTTPWAVSPGMNRPDRIICASGFSIQR